MKKAMKKVIALLLLAFMLPLTGVFGNAGRPFSWDYGWFATSFGLPEDFRPYFAHYPVCSFSVADTGKKTSLSNPNIESLAKDSPAVLVVRPLLMTEVEGPVFGLDQIVRLQYIKTNDQGKPEEGMTLTQCVILQVCRDETGLTLKEGAHIWVREEYFHSKTDLTNSDNPEIFSPYGEDLAPLEYKSLVFADIYEGATETTVLDIDPVHFTVDGPVGRTTPEREKSQLYASEADWCKEYGEKICKQFGVEVNPEYQSLSSLPSWILPGAVGFAGGGAVCTAALLIVFAAKKRKKQQPPEPDNAE